MRVSVILGHPEPGSFNFAIAEAAVEALTQNGHGVSFHDLYAERFDPILPGPEIPKGATLDPAIKSHCDEIAAADGIVIVHPNWWGQPPAILKGWVDRVIRPGVAYEFVEGDGGEGVPVGLLRAKCALVFNTSNTPLQREQEVFGDPLEALWKTCICAFCGIPAFHRRMFGVIVTSTEEQRREWLGEARELTRRMFP
jgi:putative NADPH-quinone reductase